MSKRGRTPEVRSRGGPPRRSTSAHGRHREDRDHNNAIGNQSPFARGRGPAPTSDAKGLPVMLAAQSGHQQVCDMSVLRLGGEARRCNPRTELADDARSDQRLARRPLRRTNLLRAPWDYGRGLLVVSRDEAICNVRTQNPVSRHVRRVQRRIQRVWRALPPDPGFEDADIGYFTFDDLRRRRVVRSGIRGRNREAPS